MSRIDDIVVYGFVLPPKNGKASVIVNGYK